MKSREIIIQLLKYKIVTGYNIEIMSNGRMRSAVFRRYKNRVKFEENSFYIFNLMPEKAELLLLELAEETLRLNPQTIEDVDEMIREYSFKTKVTNKKV